MAGASERPSYSQWGSRPPHRCFRTLFATFTARGWTPPQSQPMDESGVQKAFKAALHLHADTGHFIEPPAIHRLSQITAPTLIIIGNNDVPDMLAMADMLAQHVPFARKVVAGAGHMVNMEAPDQVNEAILDFLRAL